MKTLILTAILALSFNALASESLSLADCTDGADGKRELASSSNSSSDVVEKPVSTSND